MAVNISEKITKAQPYYKLPDNMGHFGGYGGKFVPETLIPALEELESAYNDAMDDPEFHRTLESYLKDYVGRPSPLYLAERLSREVGGARIYFKREDLNHTGSHKINNALGQVLLARRMGKSRIIAETGAGQHGVATATVAAAFGLECAVYMGTEDIRRQALNVFRMRLLGAEVVPVESGSRTLKDATNEAIRDWITNVKGTHYIIGSVVGPHPYPMMVRDFQSIIGRESRNQILEAAGALPKAVVACVGGGSNAMGIFQGFVNDPGVELIGVEAGGLGLDTGKHAASLNRGHIGVLHGSMNSLIQDEYGQIIEAHSVSAGLDYPGVGPEHVYLRDTGRAVYHVVTDSEALEGFKALCRTEGIIPALESAHAVYEACRTAARFGKADSIVVNLSGRGDKDVHQVAEILGVKI